MKYEIKVPGMGESITEATVSAILKPSGSQVAMDDEIIELETDKVNQVLYAPHAGVMTLNVKPDDVVKIGQVIGSVDSDQTAPVEAAPKAPEVRVEEPKAKPSENIEARPSKNEPAARLTKEAWLKDLQTSVASPQPQKTQSTTLLQPEVVITGDQRKETRTKMTKIRRLIASRMVEVQNSTAMLTTFNEADMSAVIALREKYKETFQKEHGVKLGFMSFFVKACSYALALFPEVNSYLDGEDIVHREYIDIGVAVGTPKGVIVPIVRNCDKLSFAQIEQAIDAYAKKAREGGLSVNDLQGGSFTITNGGIYGSMLSTPLLNPPQCAILGMHNIIKRPVAVNGEVVIRPMMYLALSYDHRLIDGKEAVSFLVHIKNHLEDPSQLLLEI